MTAYPVTAVERDRWIIGLRPGRLPVGVEKPQALLLEEEPDENGSIQTVATLFLSNRECPWRCLMCDLWKHTLEEPTPPGAIPRQIEFGLARLAEQDPARAAVARQVKLYNSGSFFDARAIPREDHPEIALLVQGFDRVIVECHPSLVGEACLRLRDLIQPARLEVAMGLETVDPRVVAKLNKRMSLEDYAQAAKFLTANGVAVRSFVLVRTPFQSEEEGVHWAKESVRFAFDAGAGLVSLIPTRSGNGALDALERAGEFTPPSLASLEEAVDFGLELRRGRVFADLWDLERFSKCADCFPARQSRMARMNLEQRALPRVHCASCVA